jgi:small-conductance mechanosensitive channel
MATIKTTSPATPSKAPRTTGMGTLFEKTNLQWMLIGVVVMAVGFILMAGGKSPDPNVFDKTKVYSSTRVTIAPIIILAGLVIEIVAIFRQPKTARSI